MNLFPIRLLAFFLLTLTSISICNAKGTLSVEDCNSWSIFVDNKSPENFAKIKYESIRTLHEQQANVTRWTNDAILSWSWDDLSQEYDYAIEGMWEVHEKEFINAIHNCDIATIRSEVGKEEVNAYLKKAELHIEQAIIELRKAHTAARIPWVANGGILPGSTKAGEASDYVENKFIPKFVNGSLVFLLSGAVLMIIISGIMFLLANGDSDAIARAKATLGWTIFGVVIMLLSFAIVRLIIGIDFSL